MTLITLIKLKSLLIRVEIDVIENAQTRSFLISGISVISGAFSMPQPALFLR